MFSVFLLTIAFVGFAVGANRPSLSKDVSTNCRVAPITERRGNPVTYKECGEIEQETWDPISYKYKMLPGACRWKEGGTEGELSMCLCPADVNTCTATGRGACYWHKDSDTGATTCISVAERFYNQLARLLAKRGKKDFSLKIQYGSAPARGELPHGPYGAAHIGMGSNPQLPQMPTIQAVPGFSPYNPRYMFGGFGAFGQGGYKGYGQGYGGAYGQRPGYGITPSYGSLSYGPKPSYGTSVYGPKPFYGQPQGSWAQASYPPQPASYAPAQPTSYRKAPQALPAGYPGQPPQPYPAQPSQLQSYPEQSSQFYPAQPSQPQPYPAQPSQPQPYPTQPSQPQPYPAQPLQPQPYPAQPQSPQPAFAAAATGSQG